MLAILVHIFHRIQVYLTVFGFLLPKKLLIFHLLIWPSMIIHWIFNDNKCILTELEVELSGKSWGESQAEFSTKLLRTLGFNLNSEDIYFNMQCDRITNIYIILYSISWVISLIRYIYG